jgi:hypothetical protein
VNPSDHRHPTSLGTLDATTITRIGKDRADELMGQVGFGELALPTLSKVLWSRGCSAEGSPGSLA